MRLWIGGRTPSESDGTGEELSLLLQPSVEPTRRWFSWPPGTFYHSRGEHNVYFWNMFDQVMIRPSILDRFKLEDFQIVDHTGEQTLVTNKGRPNQAGSDHLPILFRIH